MTDSMATQHPRIPSSTYRLQFNRWFTFTQAREIVPYLHALGVSDAYASPYFQAGAESLHGYDIIDHDSLNPEIGTADDFEALVQTLDVDIFCPPREDWLSGSDAYLRG